MSGPDLRLPGRVWCTQAGYAQQRRAAGEQTEQTAIRLGYRYGFST